VVHVYWVCGVREREGGSEMTPQEQEMIGDLIDRVQKTQLAEKDMDAEQMLQEGMGKNPDALYILAQTVLVQKYALEQAQSQLTQAKAQIEQMQQRPEPKHATSFLGSLLGRSDAPAPPPPPPQVYSAPPQGYAPPPPQGYAPQPVQYVPVGGYPPPYGAPMGMGGGGGFMRGALQTAAGVAAGALAFEGVESLMHGFGHAAGYGPGSGFGGFEGGQRPTEEIINNYYGDDRGERGGHEYSSSVDRMSDDRGFGGGRDDRDSYRGGDGGGLERASYNDGGGHLENASYDDGGSNPGLDTASYDDGGSDFEDASADDDGGGFDDGGSSGGGDDGSFA
jgi:uncharacterized protein